jgi:hypothetical protein
LTHWSSLAEAPPGATDELFSILCTWSVEGRIQEWYVSIVFSPQCDSVIYYLKPKFIKM